MTNVASLFADLPARLPAQLRRRRPRASQNPHQPGERPQRPDAIGAHADRTAPRIAGAAGPAAHRRRLACRAEEIERLGLTFLRLSEEMDRLKQQFGLTDEDLNFEPGTVGQVAVKAQQPRQGILRQCNDQYTSHGTACSHTQGLAEILERVLDKGVVIAGDIKIKLCDIELLTIQIRLLIASVDKAREMGLTWWWQQPHRPAASPPRRSRRRRRRQCPRQCPWAVPRAVPRAVPGESCRTRLPASRHLLLRILKPIKPSSERALPCPKHAKNARQPGRPRRAGAGGADVGFNLGGFLENSAAMMEKLVDAGRGRRKPLATAANSRTSIRRESSAASTGSREDGAGHQGEHEIKVEPFGNIRQQASGEPWSRTSASRWSTCTRRKTTCWCWPKSPASARRTSNWTCRRSADHPAPGAARSAIARKSRCPSSFSPGTTCTGSAQRHFEDPSRPPGDGWLTA